MLFSNYAVLQEFKKKKKKDHIDDVALEQGLFFPHRKAVKTCVAIF